MLQSMRSSAKYIWIFVTVAFIGGFLLYESSGLFGSAPITSTTAVATVNGQDILVTTWQALSSQLEQQRTASSGESISLDERDAIQNQAFDQLVSDALLSQEMRRRGITVSVDELTKRGQVQSAAAAHAGPRAADQRTVRSREVSTISRQPDGQAERTAVAARELLSGRDSKAETVSADNVRTLDLGCDAVDELPRCARQCRNQLCGVRAERCGRRRRACERCGDSRVLRRAQEGHGAHRTCPCYVHRDSANDHGGRFSGSEKSRDRVARQYRQWRGEVRRCSQGRICRFRVGGTRR